MKMAKIGLPKGSGKRLKVREKSVKSQGILKWILSGNPEKIKDKFRLYEIKVIKLGVRKEINYKWSHSYALQLSLGCIN